MANSESEFISLEDMLALCAMASLKRKGVPILNALARFGMMKGAARRIGSVLLHVTLFPDEQPTEEDRKIVEMLLDK